MKQHKGLITAIIIILIMFLFGKYVFKTDYEQKNELVEPTEDVTFRVFENTYMSVLPTE